MRWDYPPLDINPVFPGLGVIIIIIIINIIIITIVITETTSHVADFSYNLAFLSNPGFFLCNVG